MIFHCILTQITNHAISIVHLVRSGLDYSASIVLRGLFELCWMTGVILYDKDKMKLYYENAKGDKREVWGNHFKPSVIMKTLTKIEKEIILDSDLVYFLSKARWEQYGFYSKFAHNYYAPITTYAYSSCNENGEKLESSLLGNPSISDKSTLKHLIDILSYSSNLFTFILYKKHNFKFSKDNTSWKDTFILKECSLKAYLELKKQNELKC